MQISYYLSHSSVTVYSANGVEDKNWEIHKPERIYMDHRVIQGYITHKLRYLQLGTR